MNRASIEHFRDRGFLEPVDILTPPACASFHEAALAARRRQPPLDWPKGLAASAHVFHEMATHPAILQPVCALLGDDVMVWGATIMTRGPGGVHPWHSDMESASSGGATVSVWLALSGASTDASLHLVSHTHRLGVTVQQERHRRGFSRRDADTGDILQWAQALDERCELVIPMVRDGQAIFFDGNLWHSSKNDSAETRTALLLQYATSRARIRIPGYRDYDWPFEWLDWPRPACVLLKGEAFPDANRFVAAPLPPGQKYQRELTSRVEPLRLPLKTNKDTGWQPYPVFAGHTKCIDKMSCHVSALDVGASPHPPHDHDDEELLVMLSGEAELELPEPGDDGQPSPTTLRPGEFVYYPAGFSHTLTTTGHSPANYLMFKWRGTRRGAGNELAFRKHDALSYAMPSDDRPGFRPRRVFQQPTGYLGLLNCHVSTLSPGAGYDPHEDAYDVAIVLLQGTVEAAGERLVDHGVMFFAAGVTHGIFNPGPGTARYLVFEFHAHGDAGTESADATDSTTMDIGEQTVPVRLPARTAGQGASQPVFVLGSGRSGTTLVQRILNAAPDVSIFGEHNGFLTPLAQAYFAQKSKGCLRTSTGDDELADRVMQRLRNPASWPAWLNPYRAADLRTDYAHLIENWFNPPWAHSHTWGFKEIRYGRDDRVIEFLVELFPDCRFVLVVRNPVDVIASQHFFGFGTVETLVDSWTKANTTYADFARRYPDRFHLLDYHALVDAPDSMVDAMYTWLGLDPDHAPDGSAVVDVPQGRYEARPHGRLPRRMLNNAQLENIFERTGDLALALGLTLPIRPAQVESVAVDLEGDTARIGPFSNGRLITTDAVVLALWVLCDGARRLDDIVSGMAPIVEPASLFEALRELLRLGVIRFVAE